MLWWNRIFLFPAGVILGRHRVGYVAAELGQPPFGRVPNLEVEGAGLHQDEEAVLLKAVQGPMCGCLADIERFGDLPHRARNATVVRSRPGVSAREFDVCAPSDAIELAPCSRPHHPMRQS